MFTIFRINQTIYELLVVFCFVQLAFILIGQTSSIDIILAGDFASVLAIIRTFLESGTYYETPGLAWPVGIDPTAYPIANWGSWALLAILRIFFEPQEYFSFFFWVLRIKLLLAMMTAYFALRCFGVEKLIAAIGACSFVSIDFVATRSFGHFFLLDIYVIPLGVLIVSASAGWVRLPGWAIVFLTLLAGMGNFYWLFGTALMLAFVLIGQALDKHGREKLVKSLMTMAVLFAPFAIFLILWSLDGPASIPFRGPEEQPIYALRFMDAFVPRLPFVTEDGFQIYLNRIRLGVGEGTEFIGYLALLGFFCAGFVLLMRQTTQGDVPFQMQIISFIGLLALLIVVFALPFGIGSAFNIYVSSMVRAQNRLSVFISFLGVAAICLLATHWRSKLALRGRLWSFVPVIILLPISVADVDRVRNFATAIECAPSNQAAQCAEHLSFQLAPIFDAVRSRGIDKVAILPVEPFAEAGPSGQRSDYFGFIPYILEPADLDIAYSYGMQRSSELFQHLDALDQRMLHGEDETRAASTLACMGYEAVLVDRLAYGDYGARVIDALEATGASIATMSQEYSLLLLPAYTGGLPAYTLECFIPTIMHKTNGVVPNNVFVSGWWGGEDWGRWAGSREAELAWRTNSDSSVTELVLGVRGFVGVNHPQRHVVVMDGANRTLFEFTATIDNTDAQFVIPLDEVGTRAGMQRLRIISEDPRTPRDVLGTSDERSLSVGVYELEFR